MKLEEHEKRHLKALRPFLSECTVLLKSNGCFPLKEPGRIVLCGNGVRYTLKGGTGSGEVNSHFAVSVWEGFRRAGFEVVSGDWLDAYDAVRTQAREDFHKEIKRRAWKNHVLAVVEGMGAVMPEPEYSLPQPWQEEDPGTDTAVYVLSRICGEGNDRRPVKGDLFLTDTEVRDILALRAAFPNFMLALNVGGPVDLSAVSEVENILLLSQLGVDTGYVLARILLGRQYPSGHLAATWTDWEDYPAIGEFGDLNDSRYREGIYVGYRYFDSIGKKVRFPFGYGLSFTSFAVRDAEAAETSRPASYLVTAKVKNTGAFRGKELLQLYVSSPQGRLDQPYQALAGWAKTRELKPGEEETVRIAFSLREMVSYDASREAYILEAGDYVLRIGTNAEQSEAIGVIRLDETAVLRRTKNVLGTVDFEDWKPQEEERRMDSPADLPVLPLSASELGEEHWEEDRLPIPPSIRGLSDLKLAMLNVGSLNAKGGAASVIGNAGTLVAGSAGETTSLKGTPFKRRLVMADGPAGLRISRRYIVKKNSVISLGPVIPVSIMEFLPAPAAAVTNALRHRPGRKDEILYQHASAIPIGAAIAQSWNPSLAELCGDIVGREMEHYSVDLWLAPALNIHRSILCGRNFEYYSEDPLLAGRMAAAVTSGVQKHPGRGAVIKHFAANNQEKNRYNHNSMVSERALREIYLKGFEIAIRLASPHGLMSSYNLVNGEHTSESRGLNEHILRGEFAFRGLVMTDWLSLFMRDWRSRHPSATAWKIAAAGENLIMPGAKTDVMSILWALRRGKISREQLERNAARLLRAEETLCKEEEKMV